MAYGQGSEFTLIWDNSNSILYLTNLVIDSQSDQVSRNWVISKKCSTWSPLCVFLNIKIFKKLCFGPPFDFIICPGMSLPKNGHPHLNVILTKFISISVLRYKCKSQFSFIGINSIKISK